MKSIKNILLAVASITAFATSQSSIAAPNFEVMNKAAEPIGIRIFAGPDTYMDIVQPGTQAQYQKNIATSGSISVEVYPETNTTISLNSKIKYNPTKHKYLINANGKIVFLTWDPTKSTPLYPQTGKGFLRSLGGPKTSESGQPLADNITANQIVRQ